MNDVEFVRAYVIHRRLHPEYVSRCDACMRAKAFLDVAGPMADSMELPFVRIPNDFGRGQSGAWWRRWMRTLPCHYCGKSGGTIDHKIPLSKGGPNRRSNCVPACFTCNNLKGDMEYWDFLSKLRFGRISV